MKFKQYDRVVIDDLRSPLFGEVWHVQKIEDDMVWLFHPLKHNQTLVISVHLIELYDDDNLTPSLRID